jgi:serine phosphatase RsbU (regulator of sigma subunit)
LRLRPKHKLEYRWFLLRAVPHRDRTGRVIKWFGTTTDIDDQKRHLARQEETVHVLLGLLSPDSLPVLDTVRLDAVYQPAEDLANIGGDFYAAFALPDGRLMIAIGDVAGHGLPAAVSMERTRNAILTAAIDARDPALVLTKVNRVLALRGEPAFVTALVGFLDPGSGEYTYASAGHCGPLLRERGGAVRELPHGGVPLGVQEDPRFPTLGGRLEPGEMLVLYTDGIIEFDRNLDAGQKRLAAAVAAIPSGDDVRPAEFLRREVLGTAQATDDVALLTVSFRGAA